MLWNGGGGGQFDPLSASSKAKEARNMKLCAIIVYNIASITKQLKFLNSHYSIVCSHRSIVCLITKTGKKVIEILSSSEENEIHMVDSPFNENSKNIFFFPVML